jgi:acyl-CoA thioesterase I
MTGLRTLYRFRSSAVWIAVLVLAAASAACRKAADQPVSGDTESPAPTTSAQPAPAAPSGDPTLPRIVALGDSLTAGLGLLSEQAYPAVLQHRLNADGYQVEVVNAGISGDTTAGALRRLDWALEGDVRVLIVALGGNDGLRGLPVAEMKKNLAAIIEAANERRIAVLLAGMEAPPNFGVDYATEFRQAFRDLAVKYKTAFVPFLLDGVAGVPGLNQQDGIHPTAQGAQIIADRLYPVLKPLVDLSTGS